MGAVKKIKDEKARAPDEEIHLDHGDDDGLGHKVYKKVEDGEGWLVSYADMMTLLMGFFALIASVSKVDNTEFEKVRKEATRYFGGEYERPYGGLTERLKKVVKDQKLDNQVEVVELPDGVSLTISGTMLFQSGAFEVKPESLPVMEELVQAITKEAKDLSILVEGHTDNIPISSSIIASNWELSGLRAARVARLFENRGYTKEQLMIIGWGESKPLMPNQDKVGAPLPQNMTKNRRVMIKVYRQSVK